MRIGHGYDVHRFIEDAPLIIGGVTIPHTHGLEAHSDGDVLIHAICDALLGAAGLWDIGHHFPDNDDAFKGIDSRVLLRRVISDLSERGWCVGNVDATIVAQAPKMAPFIPQMRALLAVDMEVDVTAINIKATTTEKLGFAGRKEGIATHAVALIRQAD
ncbi:MAG TPA: 2-C-methyl-D-erythritol 2,4-cyclodiphosphate synthase [Methylophaga aminisulfidivorans]|jgi:2-C-methyl-D-erythritol 2,4-cyclodiphosphate synthase|uniref:2-C-methyl-D-erythritol 2,4-cyclodiphosphate synthase n=2 Tax=Methylophaga TaxID=40222 RepID=F5SVI1_9GAMM|nr:MULTISPECIES: 2-C-methyl-D-erythritol 2,4-cyclodiphosphate synthase [Methylophaga]EGL55630.1 2C-methyl-D-erythritol 2,4-cyclodiphosphate synthase [Methylophaga aminisulfidivorans MP]GLP98771.1 2-C-methyl-D-erythritol 2,4-cyclodiphosphate synthase [Methylophaga thalassica]HIC47789.1 2-C-methyl-D-erythritol 2,4-cyclodiphosphate synthase [Methylophaga sp.]HIM40493.1 2-C-methyl-D-erythritol 2,4-cyclodiphosphate synthase [Methylophaga aminisulfidivorans]